jgi:hypothetical protein
MCSVCTVQAQSVLFRASFSKYDELQSKEYVFLTTCDEISNMLLYMKCIERKTQRSLSQPGGCEQILTVQFRVTRCEGEEGIKEESLLFIFPSFGPSRTSSTGLVDEIRKMGTLFTFFGVFNVCS